MTFIVNHHVVRLHVPVDDLACMQRFQSAQNLRAVKKNPGLATLIFAKVEVHLV